VANQATGFKIQTENVGKTAPILAGATPLTEWNGMAAKGWLADGRRDQAIGRGMPGMGIKTGAGMEAGMGGKKAATRVVFGKSRP
jgi:hypothetical protein